MKIEQLIVQHFYNHKKVTLQGVGTFTLSPDFVLPGENDKETVMPENAISFEYNTRATEDEELIDYIVQQSRKIKPLASADLDSYLTLGRQFLHIGKPFRIEGLGVLEKNQAGQYQFTQGNAMVHKMETATTQVREKAGDDDISFAAPARPSNNNRKILLGAAALVILGLSAAAIWYLFLRKQPQQTVATTEPAADTTTHTPAVKPDSNTVTLPAPAIIPGDSSVFKVVLKDYPSYDAANKAYTRLTGYGHKLLLYTRDSVTFKVAMPIYKPLSDTTMVKDSVKKKLFGGNPYIELK